MLHALRGLDGISADPQPVAIRPVRRGGCNDPTHLLIPH